MRVSVARVGVLALFAASALLMGAGASSRILILSPENREAQAIGPLTAYIKGQSGNGDVSLKLPDGQVLKGQYKVGGSVGAYGRSRGVDRPGGAYTTSGRPIVSGSPALVDLKGDSGATVHCELMNNDADAHGSGVCRFSNGAEYRAAY